MVTACGCFTLCQALCENCNTGSFIYQESLRGKKPQSTESLADSLESLGQCVTGEWSRRSQVPGFLNKELHGDTQIAK
jgi:hypothetical protein